MKSGIPYKKIRTVEGSGMGGEGRGDLGVRFDRLNELRGERSLSLRSLSLSKGRKVGGRVGERGILSYVVLIKNRLLGSRGMPFS